MLDETLSRLITRELEELDALLRSSSDLLATPADAEPSLGAALLQQPGCDGFSGG